MTWLRAWWARVVDLIAWWTCFVEWRRQRAVAHFLSDSNDAMLVLAAERLGRELSDAEHEDLPRLYVQWLDADDARLLALSDRPVRTIHLFLSELWP